MPLRTTPTTRLPQSILDQIKDSTGNAHARTRRPQVSRKETRKQERQGRKQHKAVFFSAGQSTGSNLKRIAEEEHTESPKRKKHKAAEVKEAVSQPQGRTQSNSLKDLSSTERAKAKPRSKTALKTLVPSSHPPSNISMLLPSKSQKEKDEDAYIAYLESKLGHKSGKQKMISEDDGLDDLMDFASSLHIQRQVEEHLSEVDESSNSSSGESVPPDISGENDDGSTESEWQGFGDVADDDYNSPSIPVEEHEPRSLATATRYVPPKLRHHDEPDSEEAKVTRQLKGLLNRMSEQNMASILDNVEGLFRKHRRHDVVSILTTLIIDGISSHSSLLDSYVVLYAAFVSSLHKIIGVEFAAYIVQNVVSTYERHHSKLIHQNSSDKDEADNQGKECVNMIVLLSELYNFQVISSTLVFDIIRGLLDKQLTEFDVELLLKIVRNSGTQLRQDDPSALKDIIQIVQSKVSTQNDVLSSRTRFMIETLTNLKNNKLKRNTTQNQGGDAVERMKKFLSSLNKSRHVLAHEPLRVSLDDLHSAESKGKWWLVGAAWGGDPLVDRQEAMKSAAKDEEVENNSLLRLARKHGMNTSIRRSIFIVLMSGDDYVDACERLAQLNLTEVQQREIVRVILHCCGNEKSYNPYYTLVCQQLCRSSHSYKVTLQFCLWDFLRELGESNVGGAEIIKNLKGDERDIDDFSLKNLTSTRIKNVAKAYAWWIAKDSCTLAVLKPVDFAIVKPRTREFLKELFTQIFINSQVSTPILSSKSHDLATTRNPVPLQEVFLKATRIDALAMGLAYFMSEAFQEEQDLDGLILWGIEIATEALRTSVGKVI